MNFYCYISHVFIDCHSACGSLILFVKQQKWHSACKYITPAVSKDFLEPFLAPSAECRLSWNWLMKKSVHTQHVLSVHETRQCHKCYKIVNNTPIEILESSKSHIEVGYERWKQELNLSIYRHCT